MYCSDECANHDAVHKESCPLPNDHYFEIGQKLITEALGIVGDFDSVVELLMDETKKTVFDFDLSNPVDPMYKKNLLIAITSLSAEVEVEGKVATRIHKKSTEREKLFIKSALKLIRLWDTNAFAMHVTTGSSPTDYGIFGSGIFPFMSLLNHSCYSNVTHITVDNKFVTVVTRPIKAGEQIFTNYGYTYFRHTREERRQGLSRYKFICDCIACIENCQTFENLPKINPHYKEPEFHVYSTKASIKQFKVNCEFIEKNIKKNPTYEVEQLMLHNEYILHRLAKLNF